MYLFSSKKAKISIDYNGNIANFELCHYDTLGHLKEVTSQFFPEITFNPLLYHQHKPLSDYDDAMQLSELTKGKTFLHLSIEKPTSLPAARGKKRLSIDNPFSFRSKCTNSKHCTSDCTISFFCINCREFLCLNCKVNHQQHKTFLIDVNSIKDSVKSFAISLQAEISNELNKYKEIESMLKHNVMFDFDTWKKEILEKLNKIEGVFQAIRGFEGIIQNQMKAIETLALETSNKIEKKLNDYLTEKRRWNDIDQGLDVIEFLSKAYEVIDSVSKENELRKEELKVHEDLHASLTSLDSLINNIEKSSKMSYNEIKERIKLIRYEEEETGQNSSRSKNKDCSHNSVDFSANDRLNTGSEQDNRRRKSKRKDFRNDIFRIINQKKNTITPLTSKAFHFSKYLQLNAEEDLTIHFVSKKSQKKKAAQIGHSVLLPNLNVI